MTASPPRRPLFRLMSSGLAVSLIFIVGRFLLTPIRMRVITEALPPADYGMITLLSMSVHGLAMLLSLGGFEWLLARLPAAGAGERGRLYGLAAGLSGGAGLVAAVLIGLGCAPALWYSGGGAPLSGWAIAIFFLLILHVQQRLYYLLGCREHLRARITQLLWSDAWFVILLAAGSRVAWNAGYVLWAWSAWMALLILLTVRWVPLRLWPAGPARPGQFRDLLLTGLPMMPVVLSEWSYRLAGQYALLAWHGAEVMALYALAFNIAFVGCVAGVPLVDLFSTEINALVPAGSDRTAVMRTEAFRGAVSRALRFVLVISLPVGLVLFCLPAPLIHLLAAAKYQAAAGLLPWCAALPGLFLLHLLGARVLTVLGRRRLVAFSAVGGGLLSVVLCVAWSRPYGAEGTLAAIHGGLLAAVLSLYLGGRLVSCLSAREFGGGRLFGGAILLGGALIGLARLPWPALGLLAAAGAIGAVVMLAFRWVTPGDFPARAAVTDTMAGGLDDE